MPTVLSACRFLVYLCLAKMSGRGLGVLETQQARHACTDDAAPRNPPLHQHVHDARCTASCVGMVHVPCSEDYDHDDPHRVTFSWRKLWLYTGPGWLVSMAYLDPGNLTSDLQQGAYTQYKLLWVLWWSTVAGWLLQTIAARVGFVTGKDLAEVCREELPRWVCYILFANMELAIIGADIQEVLGSAIAIKILFGVPLWGGCVITAFSTFCFLAVQKYGVQLLEAFFAGFIGIMAVCFMINWGEAGSPAGPFMTGWAEPTLSRSTLLQAVGALGAVIMPHNLYLHSGLVLSRNIDRKNWAPPSPKRSCTACRSGGAAVHMVAEGNYYNALASATALLLSFFINAAIVATFAAKFYNSRCSTMTGGPYGCIAPESVIRSSCDDETKFCSKAGTNMKCIDATSPTAAGCAASGYCTFPDTGIAAGVCSEIGMLLAGEALNTSMGEAAKYVWGIGLLAAGQAATITATYAGQIVFAGFIKLDMPMWAVMLITRGFALGPSLALALIADNDQGVSATMNEWLNALQSFQLPFSLVPALLLAGNKRIMGEFATTFKWQVVTWILAILLLCVNTYFAATFLTDPTGPIPQTNVCRAVVILYAVSYFGFIVYMCRHELTNFWFYLSGNSERRDSMLGNLSLVCHRVPVEEADPLRNQHNQSDLSLNLLPPGTKRQSARLGTYGSLQRSSPAVNPMLSANLIGAPSLQRSQTK